MRFRFKTASKIYKTTDLSENWYKIIKVIASTSTNLHLNANIGNVKTTGCVNMPIIPSGSNFGLYMRFVMQLSDYVKF